MAKPRWLQLLEEHEKHDIEVGRVYIELSEMLEKMPLSERRRVKRFIEEWLEGKHTLVEAKKLLEVLKKKYGGSERGC